MRRAPLSIVAVAAAAGLAACGVVDREPNMIAGKAAFVQKCGSCHGLARAGTKGTSGPNLDEAFRQSLADGFKRSTIVGVVDRQIQLPNRGKQIDPVTHKPTIAMPADLVKGDLARDVSEYVASVAAKGGKDTGRLAEIGNAEAKGVAKAKNGVVDIPADPEGQLAYTFATAEVPAGKVTFTSKNESNIDHNIAVDGQGLDEKGPVVKDGGISKLTVTLKPGNYAFYCSVAGHREGGMEGKLTVK